MRTAVLLFGLRLAVWLTGHVDRRRAKGLCRWAGAAWWSVAPQARAAVQANLHQVLSRSPGHSQVRAVFQHGVLNYWDTLALPQRSPDELLRLLEGIGWEHLDAALARGKGAILAGAHLSSLALAGQAIAARGYRVSGGVEPTNPPEVFEFLNRFRQAFGVRLYPAGRRAAAEILAALRRNEVVAIISDRHVEEGAVTVRFLGRETAFSDAAAVLSLRTGAAILPAVAIRQEDGSFRGCIEPPIQVQTAGNASEDVRRLTQALADRLGYHIVAHPEQWTVFQPRWPGSMGSRRERNHAA